MKNSDLTILFLPQVLRISLLQVTLQVGRIESQAGDPEDCHGCGQHVLNLAGLNLVFPSKTYFRIGIFFFHKLE